MLPSASWAVTLLALLLLIPALVLPVPLAALLLLIVPAGALYAAVRRGVGSAR